MGTRHGHVEEVRARLRPLAELQARCDDISSSVLNDRLAELRDAGVLTHDAGGGYRLTQEGDELLTALEPVDSWAKRWAARADRRLTRSRGRS